MNIAMDAILLKTKLYVPAARPELVPRPHLIPPIMVGDDARRNIGAGAALAHS